MHLQVQCGVPYRYATTEQRQMETLHTNGDYQYSQEQIRTVLMYRIYIFRFFFLLNLICKYSTILEAFQEDNIT